MKTLLKFALVICLMFAFTNSQAQIKFGPRVGVNLSSMTFKGDGASIDPIMLLGFNVGAIADVAFSESISFQTGILYTTKGAKYKVDFGDGEFEMTVAPSFLEVPLNVVYGFGTGATKITVLGGAYVGYGIGGNVKAEGVKEKITWGSDGDFKSIDFGINIGAGVNFNGLLVAAQYELGLANLSTTDGVENKVSVIGVSVTYLFGGK